MNIVLLYGGRSGEHEISLISAAAVARGLNKAHHVQLVSVAKDGSWYLEDDAVVIAKVVKILTEWTFL